jgi:hypothetical protein
LDGCLSRVARSYSVKIQFVSKKKKSMRIGKTSRLIIFRETVGIYCENYTKRISKLCGKMQILVVLQLAVRTDNLHGL